MQDLLDLCEKLYVPDCPMVCFDELPFQLLGDVRVPIPMTPGKVYCYDPHLRSSHVRFDPPRGHWWSGPQRL